MLDWFIWKDERCTLHGIHMLVPPNFTTPEERSEFVSIPGRSGSMEVKELANHPVYNELQFSVTCVVDDLTNIDTIIDYLEGSSKVEFANKSGGYYHAAIVSQVDFAKVLRDNPHRSFGVTFRCYDPFWYFNDDDDFEIPFDENQNGVLSLINRGTVYSEPVIDIHFQPPYSSENNGFVAVNGHTINFNNFSTSEHILRIDIPMDECYWVDKTTKEITAFANNIVSCDQFPIFEKGENVIVTDLTKLGTVKIRPRWRKRL